MDREISVNLTPLLVRWTIYYQLRPLFLFLSAMFLLIAWNIWMVLSHGGVWSTEAWLSILPYFLIPVFLTVLLYRGYTKNLALIRKMKTPVMKYRFTDEWLYVESDLTTGKNAWSLYRGLLKHKKIWRLLTHPGAAHVFPTELLDSELKAFLTSKVPKAERFGRRFLRLLTIWLVAFAVILYLLRNWHH